MSDQLQIKLHAPNPKTAQGYASCFVLSKDKKWLGYCVKNIVVLRNMENLVESKSKGYGYLAIKASHSCKFINCPFRLTRSKGHKIRRRKGLLILPKTRCKNLRVPILLFHFLKSAYLYPLPLYFRLRICIFKCRWKQKSHRQDKPIDTTIAFTLPVASHLCLD